MAIAIVGPMTGLPNYNFDAFAKAKATLLASGFVVLNPADNFDGRQDLDKSAYLRKSVTELAKADAVAILNGWEDSEGSILELANALAWNLPLYFMPDPEVLYLPVAPRDYVASIVWADPDHAALVSPDADEPVAACVGCEDCEEYPQEGDTSTSTLAEIFGMPAHLPCNCVHCGVLGHTCPPGWVPDYCACDACAVRRDAIYATMAYQARQGTLLRGEAAIADFMDRAEAARLHDAPTVDGGGYKASMDADIQAKPAMQLVPRAALAATGRALGYGARKYSPHNYRRGMAWSEPYGALLRHVTAWFDGEDRDQESGLHHLDNAGAMLAFLQEFVSQGDLYKRFDDRFRRPLTVIGDRAPIPGAANMGLAP